ncbi:unnamed protein product [Calicophoron daubneyi]|uniref:Kinesin motor domain-containing protein n=1 Tax=Calicophoron daubneyi TaxID=300641 RepID=A0AAV2T6C5_CALDB
MSKEGQTSEQASAQPSRTTSGCLDNCSSSLVGDSPSVCASNEVKGPKYKYFYNRLYKCLCYLEEENRKLLEAVQRKERLTGHAKRLDELLDEFAFKVASKKDQYEKSLTEQATSEGQQAFMAKRWKMRYHNLLDLVTLFEKKMTQVKLANSSDNHLRSQKKEEDGEQRIDNDFLDEALSLPWEPAASFDDAMVNAIADISCYSAGDMKRTVTSYEFNDFTIPISSVFIQDLLANHNICAEEIKRQNEIKCRLFHVLKKTKEQRNQLKKFVTEQENQIQTLERSIQDVETLLVKKSGTGLTPSQKDNSPGVISEGLKGGAKSSVSNTLEVSSQEDLAKLQELEQLKQELQRLELYKCEVEGILKEEEQQRRVLSRRLQDLVGTIHVTCRIKPHPNNYLQIISDDKLLLPRSLSPLGRKAGGGGSSLFGKMDNSQMRCFIFEKVLGPGTEHHEVFRRFNQPLTKCLDGYSMCVMTYGPRKSGKSFTMFGNATIQKQGDNLDTAKGIAQDAVHLLFSLARQRTSWEFKIRVQAIAVNDEAVLDLLKDAKCSFMKAVKSSPSDTDEVYSHSKTIELTNSSEFEGLVQAVREGEMKKSQPSHVIIRLTIEGSQKSSKDVTIQSTLLLADLASWDKRGNTDEFDMPCAQSTPISESASQSTSMTPVATKLSSGVNQSLLALSRVFTALRKRKIPSFKDSTLTRILKPVLTGESKCFLIITINSDPNEFTSTLASLQFAQNAMQVTTRLSVDQRLARSGSPRSPALERGP